FTAASPFPFTLKPLAGLLGFATSTIRIRSSSASNRMRLLDDFVCGAVVVTSADLDERDERERCSASDDIKNSILNIFNDGASYALARA
ncbi:MAG: hypothetical protein VB934_19170, partial [Polyangiaceae bacterium]